MTKSNLLAEVIEFKPPEFKAGDIARAKVNDGIFLTKGRYYLVDEQYWISGKQVVAITNNEGHISLARACHFIRIDPQHAPEGFMDHERH